MTVFDDAGRPEPEPAVDEVQTLLGFLDYQRATLEWKCRGLGTAGMTLRVARSTMTLAGLLNHMSWVEDHWFSFFLHDRERAGTWSRADFAADPDWEWNEALSMAPDDVRARWAAACESSRRDVAAALATGGLDQLARRTWDNGEAPSLRWILVHMIEEYARHNGHADLLREAADGQTGE